MLVVDGRSGELHPDALEIVDAAQHRDDDQIEHELSHAQVESGSRVCQTLDELRTSLTSLRRRLNASARARGARLMASGTHPSSPWTAAGGVIPEKAYLKLSEDYARLTDEQVVLGCHVHVGVGDPELAIQEMNRARVHVPELLALSANCRSGRGSTPGTPATAPRSSTAGPRPGCPSPLPPGPSTTTCYG